MKENAKAINKNVLVALLSAAIGAGTMYLGLYISNPAMFKYSDEVKVIDECRKVIAENGSPDFDDEAASRGMINGFLNAGGDKYTNYYDTFAHQDTTDYVNSSGTAKASGFSVDMAPDGNIIVTDIVTGLAADRCGLCIDDVIIEIAGENVIETGYDTAVRKMLGKQDTVVMMTVVRDGKEVNIEFKRDNAPLRNVKSKKYGSIGYMRITYFDDFTEGNLRDSIEELGDVDSYIIDLRNCPGGKTKVCVKTASEFISEGKVVLHNYSGNDTEYDVDGDNNVKVHPIVLLTNEHTASSAEILTALIKQNNQQTTIVGTKTLGKGIFQNEYIFDSGMRLRYTAGEYTVGDWECYHGVGIPPDMEIPMDNALIGTDDDIQLKKALELLD